MRTTFNSNKKKYTRKSLVLLGIIAGWLVIIFFAAIEGNGVIINALAGLSAISLVVYLAITAMIFRSDFLKNRRDKIASNYHVGEDYLKIFTANK